MVFPEIGAAETRGIAPALEGRPALAVTRLALTTELTVRQRNYLEKIDSAEGIAAAEQEHEREISADRHRIGTTRGGQPIEELEHPDGTA